MQEYIGLDEIKNLRTILGIRRPKKIFLVTGKSSYEKYLKPLIEPELGGYDYFRYSDFEPNPKLSDIEKGIESFKQNDCDFVVAVGGGSVIDTAKTINIFAANTKTPKDYIVDKQSFAQSGAPLVVMPTTSGSGSEATHFAVVYIDKTKYSLAHKFILPDYVIVDPRLTASLPSKITAVSGMDALSQAIESYWCINSTDVSKDYSAEAVRLVMDNLTGAVNNPSEKSRFAMAKAANLAGKAINITKTTAPHAISYPITSYFGVSHGLAVSLTLTQVLFYNSGVNEDDVLDSRGVDYVKQTINELMGLLGASTLEDTKNKIDDLKKSIGLPSKLSELNITSDQDIELIINQGFNPDRVKNNPRRLTKQALRNILAEIRT